MGLTLILTRLMTKKNTKHRGIGNVSVLAIETSNSIGLTVYCIIKNKYCIALFKLSRLVQMKILHNRNFSYILLQQSFDISKLMLLFMLKHVHCIIYCVSMKKALHHHSHFFLNKQSTTIYKHNVNKYLMITLWCRRYHDSEQSVHM